MKAVICGFLLYFTRATSTLSFLDCKRYGTNIFIAPCEFVMLFLVDSAKQINLFFNNKLQSHSKLLLSFCQNISDCAPVTFCYVIFCDMFKLFFKGMLQCDHLEIAWDSWPYLFLIFYSQW